MEVLTKRTGPAHPAGEVARVIGALPATRGAFIIAFTGQGQAESRVQSVEAGFDHSMVKPADNDPLLSSIADPEAARKDQAGFS